MVPRPLSGPKGPGLRSAEGVHPWPHPPLRLGSTVPDVELAELQDLMERTYGARDRDRGPQATLAWLTEELGELARAVRKGTREEQLHELGDVLAWLASLAAQLDLSLEAAAARYGGGCPKCGAVPCRCG